MSISSDTITIGQAAQFKPIPINIRNFEATGTSIISLFQETSDIFSLLEMIKGNNVMNFSAASCRRKTCNKACTTIDPRISDIILTCIN